MPLDNRLVPLRPSLYARDILDKAIRSAGRLMKWDDVMQEVVSGTVTALVWGVLLWAFNFIRNWKAERKLRHALSWVGVSQENDTFGVMVKNDSEYEITVRDVTLLTNKPEEAFTLLFAERTYDYLFQEKNFKDPRNITQHQRSSQRPPPVLVEKGADLGPFMTGTWKTHVAVFLDHPDLIPNKCHFAIQYKSLLGNPKTLVVDSNDRCSRFIQESFQKRMEQIKRQ